MKQMVIDMQDGEVFMVTGEEIQAAIRSRVHDELRSEMQAHMKEVQGEIEGQESWTSRAGLFLSVFRGKNLSPSALLTLGCLERAVACQNEIDELMFIWHNVKADPGILYRLSLKQLVRYGMKPKVEVQ